MIGSREQIAKSPSSPQNVVAFRHSRWQTPAPDRVARSSIRCEAPPRRLVEPSAIEFADELAMVANLEDACAVAVAEFGSSVSYIRESSRRRARFSSSTATTIRS